MILEGEPSLRKSAGPRAATLTRVSSLLDFGAVLFDMDGVLLDTEPLYTVAYDRMLAPYSAKLDPELKRQMMGRPALFSASLAIRKYGVPMTPEEFLERRRPILEELVREAPAIRGAEDFVRGLVRRGVRTAVATSTARPLFETKTARHPWFSLFDVTVCGDDPDLRRPKPAPDIFLLAADRLGVRAEECLIFEDSPTGIEAAIATGASVVMVRGEGTPPDPRALRVIGDFRELLSEIGGN